MRLLKDDAPHRRVKRVDATRDKKDRTSCRGREPIDICIELEQVKRDDAEDELSSDLAGHITQTGRKDSILHASALFVSLLRSSPHRADAAVLKVTTRRFVES